MPFSAKKPTKKAVAAIVASVMLAMAVAALCLPSSILRQSARSQGQGGSVVVEQREPRSADAATLRVMTLNVAHGRKNGPNQLFQRGKRIRRNLDAVAAVLRRERPHVVGLQEADGPSIWSGGLNHVEHLARAAGLPHWTRGEHVKGMKLSYGTALLSSLPLGDAASVRFTHSGLAPPKGFVVCSTHWPGSQAKEIDVASVHLDFLRSSVRRKQATELADTLSSRKRPLIVMGDFNCEWGSEDSPLRIIAKRLSLKPYRPEAPDMATFPRSKKRLDWILISADLKFVTYAPLTDVVSDHRPVLAETAMR